jgi:hypothetical protein
VIHHVVQCRLRADAPEAAVTRALDALDALASAPSVTALSHGRTVGHPDDGYDLTLLVVLADADAYAAYMAEPAHHEVDLAFEPVVDAVHVFDVVDHGDAATAERLRQLQAAHPYSPVHRGG